MITWPFPQWMSLIRSHWRSHWVCNCFPLGETSTAIESHLTAEFADECSLSTEWSGLILLWVVMELLRTPKPPVQLSGESDASCFGFFFFVRRDLQGKSSYVCWFTEVTPDFKHYYQSYQCLQLWCLCSSDAVSALYAAVCDYVDHVFLFFLCGFKLEILTGIKV